MSTTKTTTYSSRSNATRAAKKAGLADFTIVESGGKFGFAAKAAKPTARRARKEPNHGAPLSTANGTLIKLVTKGAPISKLMEALGWQAHSVRGSLSRLGKAGFVITRTRIDGESHYRLEA
jgi:hypothetical protein